MVTLLQISPAVEQKEDSEQEATLERFFRILIHNDDVTPFDFVIRVLLRFFELSPPEAESVTWTAHTTGIAVVAVMPLNEAQRRVGRAHFAAGLEGYPLTFTIEPE